MTSSIIRPALKLDPDNADVLCGTKSNITVNESINIAPKAKIIVDNFVCLICAAIYIVVYSIRIVLFPDDPVIPGATYETTKDHSPAC